MVGHFRHREQKVSNGPQPFLHNWLCCKKRLEQNVRVADLETNLLGLLIFPVTVPFLLILFKRMFGPAQAHPPLGPKATAWSRYALKKNVDLDGAVLPLPMFAWRWLNSVGEGEELVAFHSTDVMEQNACPPTLDHLTIFMVQWASRETGVSGFVGPDSPDWPRPFLSPVHWERAKQEICPSLFINHPGSPVVPLRWLPLYQIFY